MVRVLLCGDVRGKPGLLCEHVARLHARLDASQHFQAVFCVGEFSAEDMDLEHRPPIPVHFIDSGPAAADLIEVSPQGEEVGPNLHFLGHFGVVTVAGLKVAFLSGRRHAELFGDEAAAAGADEADVEAAEAPAISVKDLTQKYGAQDTAEGPQTQRPAADGAAAGRGPSWEDLKAKEARTAFVSRQLFVDGCYTPLAVERLMEEIADAGGVDLLLTSEWPAGCLRGVARAWPEEMETRRLVKTAAKHCSSTPVGELAAAAEPKYHAVGLGGVFWRRVPWKHERRGEVVQSTGELRCGACRMITLGAADGSRPGVAEQLKGPAVQGTAPAVAAPEPKPQKWLHGLDLDPSTLPAGADDATPSPWSEKVVAAASGSGAGDAAAPAETGPCRPDFGSTDAKERKRWLQRFGCAPDEMQRLSDKLAKEAEPKEKKEKHKSLYKVSEKEKKRRKTGGDGHLPFAARERMASKG